jgi:hypothetical protein
MGLADWLRRRGEKDDDEREPDDETDEREDEDEGDEEDPTVYPLW